jgi:malic enzyme
VFPSILRSLLDLRVKLLEEDTLVAIADAIARLVEDTQLKEDSFYSYSNNEGGNQETHRKKTIEDLDRSIIIKFE